MVDRWAHRSEPGPGQGKLYWHILFRDDPEVQALAAIARQRLSSFSGLHFTPRKWLHLTARIVGLAEDFTASDLEHMTTCARQLLAGLAPITISLGKVLYHPEAILLGIQPAGALDPVFKAVQAAANVTTGTKGVEREPWRPHVTVAYSTSVQPAKPIITALGRELPSCTVSVNRIHLVVQEGAERAWNWRPIVEIPLGATADLWRRSRLSSSCRATPARARPVIGNPQ